MRNVHVDDWVGLMHYVWVFVMWIYWYDVLVQGEMGVEKYRYFSQDWNFSEEIVKKKCFLYTHSQLIPI